MKHRTSAHHRSKKSFSRSKATDVNEVFQIEVELHLQHFIKSNHESLDLPPMSANMRRIAHQVAPIYNLTSESVDDGMQRFVRVHRGDNPSLPDNAFKTKRWDFGQQTFSVNPGNDGIQLDLKYDGTLQIHGLNEESLIIDSRKITSNKVQIRNGQIIEHDDEGWH